MKTNQHPKPGSPSGKSYMRMPTGKIVSQQDQIRQRAYQLFELRGGQQGLADQDWYNAERELLTGR